MQNPAQRARAQRPGMAAVLLSTIVLSALLPDTTAGAWRLPLIVALAMAAVPLVFTPMLALRRYGAARPDASYMDATVVVTRGPFAWLRHPQYLGYMLIGLIFVLVNPAWPVLLGAALAGVLFYATAVAEEQDLLARHGAAYATYRARVPRFNVLLRP